MFSRDPRGETSREPLLSRVHQYWNSVCSREIRAVKPLLFLVVAQNSSQHRPHRVAATAHLGTHL